MRSGIGSNLSTEGRSNSTVTRRVAVVLALVALVAATALHARTHRGGAARFEVLAHLNPGGAYSADVWGHRGYAYLSSFRNRQGCPARGVRVVDVRDPRRPAVVARFGSVAGTWTEKTIVRRVATPSFTGDLAVTSMQSCRPGAWAGFGVYDVTNPRRPRQLALVRTKPRGSHEIWLGTPGRRAFVYTAIVRSELMSSPDWDPKARTASTPGPPDFRIFDVTDPRRPVQAGSWGAWKALGIHPNNGRGVYPANLVHSVITDDAAERAYLSHWDLGTVILDISRPARPRYLGRTRLPAGEPQGDAHSAALTRGGRLLIETHETVVGRPTLFDVSNPRRPMRVATIRLPEADEAPKPHAPYYEHSVHDPKVLGDHAYFSWYREGIVVADISRPAKPKIVARFVPPGAPDPTGDTCRGDGGSCAFVWGVFATRDYVLASDMNSGLWILRLTRGR
jgi:hypothetical protein